jgi:hypothetical protein
MPESAARIYIGHAKEALKQGTSIAAVEKAMFLASLAQAEATLEVADLLRNGIPLQHAEELGNALTHLAYKLPDR